MKNTTKNLNLPGCKKESQDKNYFHEYAPYPIDKELFANPHEDADIQAEALSKKKKSDKMQKTIEGKDFNHDYFDSDLDISDSKLKDKEG